MTTPKLCKMELPGKFGSVFHNDKAILLQNTFLPKNKVTFAARMMHHLMGIALN